jgi:hypothetical protein
LSDVHITVEMLRAVARGKVPSRVLVDIGIEHLLELCPTCRQEFLAWRREQDAEPGSQTTILRALPILLERHGQEELPKQVAADREFRELARLGHSERLARIRRANRRFRSVSLVSKLLAESRRLMPIDPLESYRFAEAAEAALRRGPVTPATPELGALAGVLMGNSLRARGLLKEARVRFDFVRFLVKVEGGTDPAVLAEIDLCEGALALDQRHFGEAEKLLNRSIHLYTAAEDRPAAAHPMLTLGRVHAQRGDYGRAIGLDRSRAAFRPRGADG